VRSHNLKIPKGSVSHSLEIKDSSRKTCKSTSTRALRAKIDLSFHSPRSSLETGWIVYCQWFCCCQRCFSCHLMGRMVSSAKVARYSTFSGQNPGLPIPSDICFASSKARNCDAVCFPVSTLWSVSSSPVGLAFPAA
jgi:hypothetical protein